MKDKTHTGKKNTRELPAPHINIFRRKVSLWKMFVVIAAAILVLFYRVSIRKPVSASVATTAPVANNNARVLQQRLNDYRFTSPLLFNNYDVESKRLNSLKSSVEAVI